MHYAAGPVEAATGKVEHTIEPTLRKCGMPTRLNKGIVELLSDYTVCEKGDKLTPDQCVLLKIFGFKMSSFQMKLVCQWEDTEFKMLSTEEEEEEEEEEELDELAFHSEDEEKGY